MSFIYTYKENVFKEITNTTQSCDDICNELCKELKISPSTRLLFSLRILGTTNWLPGCKSLVPNVKYEFRMRYKVR